MRPPSFPQRGSPTVSSMASPKPSKRRRSRRSQHRPWHVERWSIWELQLAWLPERTRHLVGFVLEEQSGRVSSPVEGIDAVSRTVTSESGRAFVLAGPPGVDPDADYVMSILRRLGAVTSERNVTTEVVAALVAAGVRQP